MNLNTFNKKWSRMYWPNFCPKTFTYPNHLMLKWNVLLSISSHCTLLNNRVCTCLAMPLLPKYSKAAWLKFSVARIACIIFSPISFTNSTWLSDFLMSSTWGLVCRVGHGRQTGKKANEAGLIYVCWRRQWDCFKSCSHTHKAGLRVAVRSPTKF